MVTQVPSRIDVPFRTSSKRSPMRPLGSALVTLHSAVTSLLQASTRRHWTSSRIADREDDDVHPRQGGTDEAGWNGSGARHPNTRQTSGRSAAGCHSPHLRWAAALRLEAATSRSRRRPGVSGPGTFKLERFYRRGQCQAALRLLKNSGKKRALRLAVSGCTGRFHGGICPLSNGYLLGMELTRTFLPW